MSDDEQDCHLRVVITLSGSVFCPVWKSCALGPASFHHSLPAFSVSKGSASFLLSPAENVLITPPCE